MTIAKEYKEKFELTFEHAWTDWCKPEYAFSSYADNVVKDGNTFTVGEFETFYNDTANHQKKKPSLKAMFVEPYSRKRKASEETSSGQIAKKSKLTKTQEILKNETAAIVAVIKSDESYKRINKNDEEEDQDRLELIEALGNSLDIKVNSKKYQAMKQDDSDETYKDNGNSTNQYAAIQKRNRWIAMTEAGKKARDNVRETPVKIKQTIKDAFATKCSIDTLQSRIKLYNRTLRSKIYNP